MSQIAERLASLLNTVPGKLGAYSETEAAQKEHGRWSKKEILGHLIDSAGNNNQRFVRAQFTPHLDFPRYEQEPWVAAQRYQDESWINLLSLWLTLNHHLVRVIRGIPADCLPHTISIGGAAPVTLEFVVNDYLRHLEHHLEQITG